MVSGNSHSCKNAPRREALTDPVAVGKKLLQEAVTRPRGAELGAEPGRQRGAGKTVFTLRGLNRALRFLHHLVPGFCVCSIFRIL